MTTRLTRKEQQARTRSALLESATRVLAEKVLHGASIDDITSAAGFTKGAFYANFTSKEELFLVMLDEHFAERLAAVRGLISGQDGLAEEVSRAGQDFTDALRGDQDWCRLFLEFTSHATRDDGFRDEFVARTQALRDQIATIYAERAAAVGFVPPVSPERIARMVFAMAHGVALDQLIDDESPQDLFGSMLRLVFAGLASSPPPDTK